MVLATTGVVAIPGGNRTTSAWLSACDFPCFPRGYCSSIFGIWRQKLT